MPPFRRHIPFASMNQWGPQKIAEHGFEVKADLGDVVDSNGKDKLVND